MAYKVRLASVKDLDNVINLLNKVTLKLLSKGIEQWEHPWGIEEIKPDIIEKRTYVLIKEKALIGTFSIKEINEKKVIESDYLYRIAVDPDFQGENLGNLIVNYACDLSRTNKKNLYLDCWSGNHKLRQFYEDAGLIYCGDQKEADYFISIFKSMFEHTEPVRNG